MYYPPADPNRPHWVGFHTVDKPLEDGAILVGEMAVLLNLAIAASLRNTRHRFYPVRPLALRPTF